MPTHTHHAGEESASQRSRRVPLRMVGHVLVKLVILASLLSNFYLIGLLRHSPGSYDQLKAGGTAAYPGTITKASAKQLTIKTSEGTERVAVDTTTPYALFPKDYQTLIPVGLPSSLEDIVPGKTEASVSAQLPYLNEPQALRVNLVRDDVLTGKMIEVTGNTLKFKGFAAAGAKEETRTLAGNATYLKLGADGTLAAASRTDLVKDIGLYAYLDKTATDASGQITKLVIAEFSSQAVQ